MPPDSGRNASSSLSLSSIPPNPPEGGTIRYAKGRRRNGSNGHAAIGIVAAEESKWRTRLNGFKQSGVWMEMFGARPGEPDCLAPVALVKEILGSHPKD